VIDVFVRFTCTTLAVANSAFKSLQKLFHGFLMNYNHLAFCVRYAKFRIACTKILLTLQYVMYVSEFTISESC
jgi:hypothetical protein